MASSTRVPLFYICFACCRILMRVLIDTYAGVEVSEDLVAESIGDEIL